MTLLRRCDAWFAAPGPATRLAALRYCIGGFASVYLLVRLPHWVQPLSFQRHDFAPVGVLAWLPAPLPAWLLYALIALASVASLTFTAGYRARLSGPCHAVTLLLLTSYRNSWGMLFHVENLLVLHTFALAFAPVASVWSLDARRSPEGPRVVSLWSVRLLCALTLLTYFVAGVAKLRHSGLAWTGGAILREHVAYDALRKIELGAAASPFGVALVRHPWIFPPLAWLTVLLELGAPLALLGSRLSRYWCGLAWSFHVGVLFLMGIVFPYPLLLIAYLPFFPIERWFERGARRLTRGTKQSLATPTASRPHPRDAAAPR